MKTICISLTDPLHYKVTNKCKYYDYSIQSVVSILLTKFTEGEFDKTLNLPIHEDIHT